MIEDLIYALRQAMNAEREEREASNKYEGYDWSYHGYDLIEARDKAQERFAKALNEVIDSRVEEKFNQMRAQYPSNTSQYSRNPYP